jgi:hypothetical protein
MNCEVMNVANKMFENIQSELQKNSASIKDLKKSIDELKSLINNLQPNNVVSHQKDNDSLNHMIKNQIIKDLTETQFIYEKQLNVWEFIDKVVEEFANETVKYLDHLKYETYDRSLVISINSRLAWKSKWRCLAGVDPKDSSIMLFHKVTIEDKEERGKFPVGTSNWHFVQCLKEKQKQKLKLKQRET